MANKGKAPNPDAGHGVNSLGSGTEHLTASKGKGHPHPEGSDLQAIQVGVAC